MATVSLPMTTEVRPYPRLPSEIGLWVEHELDEPQPGQPESSCQPWDLHKKLKQYYEHIGSVHPALEQITVTLMTLGKIRVKVADGNERVSLVDITNILDEEQAKALYKDFVAYRESRKNG